MKGEKEKREKLISVRKARNMTQDEVAKKSEINRSYYGLIENGVRNPTMPIAMKIAKALDSDIQEIFPDEIFFNNKCYLMK